MLHRLCGPPVNSFGALTLQPYSRAFCFNALAPEIRLKGTTSKCVIAYGVTNSGYLILFAPHAAPERQS